MVMNLGLIGYSELNGHPYSFGSIINGFNSYDFDSEWYPIRDYLSTKPTADFLCSRAQITKVWCPSLERGERVQKSCNISTLCSDFRELNDVSAIIIARDDWDHRNDILRYFLDLGIPCFCDKPLTANKAELNEFIPFLRNGLLYTGSGFRYAYELDVHRDNLAKSSYITSHIVNDLPKYGIHMLDALFSVKDCDFIQAKVLDHSSSFPIYELVLEDKSIFRLTCSPLLSKTFRLDYLCAARNILTSLSISDNFTAFRRTLSVFLDMVESGVNRDYIRTQRSLSALSVLYDHSRI